MKKVLVSAVIAISMMFTASKLYASLPAYHYGFILSCGETVYRSFSHELSPDELLFWADYYESVVCEGITPAVDPLP